MQMRGMRACYQIPECSLSYTKTMQGERNSKTEKRSFFRLDIAEPKLILYKDNANEQMRVCSYIPECSLSLYKEMKRTRK